MPPASPARKFPTLYRFGYRFTLLYFALTLLPAGLWELAVIWVGRVVLRLSKPVVILHNGSADKTSDYLQCLIAAAVAAAVALGWLAFDRPSRRDAVLRGVARIVLRYSLAVLMVIYGIAKVVDFQFPAPGAGRLIETYGASSPMGLLWASMGFSTGYKVFLGLAEIGGGLLLLFRRTTPLGALVVAGIMTNVFMLNLCYDVPVKLNSGQMLLMALAVLWPDLSRLANVLVLNRPAPAIDLRYAWPRRWMGWAAGALKGVIVVAILYLFAWRDVMDALHPDPTWTIDGLYRVEFEERNGRPEEPLLSNSQRWRYVAIESVFNRVTIRTVDDSALRFRAQNDPGHLRLTLTDSASGSSSFDYLVTGAHGLKLTGSLNGVPTTALLIPIELDQFPLRTRGFHWISETNFNR